MLRITATRSCKSLATISFSLNYSLHTAPFVFRYNRENVWATGGQCRRSVSTRPTRPFRSPVILSNMSCRDSHQTAPVYIASGKPHPPGPSPAISMAGIQQAREGELNAAGRKVFCVGGGIVARASTICRLLFCFSRPLPRAASHRRGSRHRDAQSRNQLADQTPSESRRHSRR